MSATSDKKEMRDKLVRYALTPLSWAYGAGTWVRNKMFDSGFLKEETFPIPVVSVGNLTVGGTGKTPQVEYIVEHLSRKYRMAVLSRGYKRKTKGFVLANSHSTPDMIGDEPMQIYRKYGFRTKVAVCEKRADGIRELMRLFPDLQLILLDDAFQHRYVKPRVSILLTDYSRPFYADNLLPLGRLRESTEQANRADMVIVTKCPDNLSPLDCRLVAKRLDLLSFQKLYFTRYAYSPIQPCFPDDSPYSVSLENLGTRDAALLLTGVANPRSFVRYFRKFPFRVRVSHYPDHHDFTRRDIQEIAARFKTLKAERKVIITTEKDAVRLAYNPYYPKELKPFTFYIPIDVEMVSVGANPSDFIPSLEELIEKNQGRGNIQ